MIFRRLVVRQRGITRGDKHFVAMLTFCGEMIAVMITTIILRRRRGASIEPSHEKQF